MDTKEDREAEYDAPATLQAIREAIASWGHEVVDLEANSELPNLLATTPVDIVFNIAEGFKGRNRESQVPALLQGWKVDRIERSSLTENGGAHEIRHLLIYGSKP